MAEKPEADEGTLNLECIVCGAFTAGPVLCTECLAKAKARGHRFERADQKIIHKIMDLIAELCASAYEDGKAGK